MSRSSLQRAARKGEIRVITPQVAAATLHRRGPDAMPCDGKDLTFNLPEVMHLNILESKYWRTIE